MCRQLRGGRGSSLRQNEGVGARTPYTAPLDSHHIPVCGGVCVSGRWHEGAVI